MKIWRMLQNCKIYDNDVGTHGLCVLHLTDSQHAFHGRTDRAALHFGVMQRPIMESLLQS